MASSGYYVQAAVLLLAVQLFCVGAADAEEAGTVIPAESRWIYLRTPGFYFLFKKIICRGSLSELSAEMISPPYRDLQEYICVCVCVI